MKKIIAISLMFALIAGAAFADVAIGGQLGVAAELLKDKGATDDVRAGFYGAKNAYVDASWAGENAGGKLRLNALQIGGWWGGDPFAFGWWKPIEQFRFQFGHNPDGDWGHAQITGWGFIAEQQDYVAISGGGFNLADLMKGKGGYLAHVAGDTGFWGGFGKAGFALSIYPVEGFEVDLGIPMDTSTPAAVTYSNTKINVKADIPDIGTVRVAADLNKANKDADLVPNLYLAFYLTAIENMAIDIGVGVVASGVGTKTNDQIQVGIGYKYEAGDLGLKVRLGAVPVTTGEAGGKDYIPLGINLLPYYNLGSLTAYLNVGVGTMVKTASGDKSSWLDFFINPYIVVPVDAGNFLVGFKFQQGSEGMSGGTKPDATWSIPIGWRVYF